MSEKEYGGDKGFSLIELLVVMAISGILLTAIYSTFFIQKKSFDVQNQVNEMVQSARAAMDMMSREIRMAGYYLQNTGFNGIPYNATQLRILADLSEDGDTSDANEDITYSHDSANLRINRITGGVTYFFADNVQSFSLLYLDSSGIATTTTSQIREVRITITTRTAKPDPDYSANGGYRSYTLTSRLTPKNLSL